VDTPNAFLDYFKAMGKAGGKARAKNMSASDRTKAARKAAKALWAKRRKVKAS